MKTGVNCGPSGRRRSAVGNLKRHAGARWFDELGRMNPARRCLFGWNVWSLTGGFDPDVLAELVMASAGGISLLVQGETCWQRQIMYFTVFAEVLALWNCHFSTRQRSCNRSLNSLFKKKIKILKLKQVCCIIFQTKGAKYNKFSPLLFYQIE